MKQSTQALLLVGAIVAFVLGLIVMVPRQHADCERQGQTYVYGYGCTRTGK